MDFFNPGSFSESKLSMDHIRELANIAANDYLREGIEPTTSLVKTAQQEDFTPHQVQVMAGEINKIIHQQKYASEEDKYHAANFPLADAAEAVQRMQLDGGAEKVACAMPEPQVSGRQIDPFRAFGFEAEPMDKTAGLRHEVKHAQQKVDLIAQKASDELILSKYAAESAERQLIKDFRQTILKSAATTSERMKALGHLSHFCKHAGYDRQAGPVLAKVASVLAGEGLLEPGQGKAATNVFLGKTADEKAPQDLISPNLEARVVNGKHPLYIRLKTFVDTKNALELNEQRCQVIQDKSSIIAQKARAL